MKICNLIFALCLFSSGCAFLSSDITFSPVYGLSDAKITSRTTLAKISNQSEKTLEKKGYAYIGSVRSEDTVRTCSDKDCSDFTCTSGIPHRDTTKEILEKAASNGGDLVVIEKDSTPTVESTSKEGKCLAGHHTTYTDRVCDYTNYRGSPSCSMVTKQRWECTSYEYIDVKKCTFVSAGTVWRYDPELAIELSKRHNEWKLKQAEIEKKEKFKVMQKTYKENGLKDFRNDIKITERDCCWVEKVGDKYGFKEKVWSKELVIAPQYTEVSVDYFREDLAAVAIGENDKKLWGFIDKTGKWVIKPSFQYAGNFYDGLALVKKDNKFGYINKTGKWVIRPSYLRASRFSWGFASVIVHDKWGYIDKKGNLIIKPQFDNVWIFLDGIAKVKVGKKEGYVNEAGEVFLEQE